MGITNFNIDHTVQDAVGAARDKSKSTFESIIGGADSALHHQYAGGSFVGVSAAGLGYLLEALEKFVVNVQSVINDFDENGDISQAFVGAPKEAAQDFIKAIKQLLTTYVSSLRMIKAEATEAFNNFSENAKMIQGAIESDANSLRSSANDINLDL